MATLQALSGTGSLRVGAAFLGKFMPGRTVYLSNPTWCAAVLPRSVRGSGRTDSVGFARMAPVPAVGFDMHASTSTTWPSLASLRVPAPARVAKLAWEAL